MIVMYVRWFWSLKWVKADATSSPQRKRISNYLDLVMTADQPDESRLILRAQNYTEERGKVRLRDIGWHHLGKWPLMNLSKPTAQGRCLCTRHTCSANLGASECACIKMWADFTWQRDGGESSCFQILEWSDNRNYFWQRDWVPNPAFLFLCKFAK